MAFITANFWLWGTQKETNVSVGHKQDVIAVVRHFSQHSTQFFQDATWEMKSRVVRAWALSLYFGGPFPVRHPAPLHVLVPWGSLIEETSFWWILQGVKWQSEDMNSSGNYLPHPPEHMSCWAHLPAKSCWIHLHKEQCCFCFQARLRMVTWDLTQFHMNSLWKASEAWETRDMLVRCLLSTPLMVSPIEASCPPPPNAVGFIPLVEDSNSLPPLKISGLYVTQLQCISSEQDSTGFVQFLVPKFTNFS